MGIGTLRIRGTVSRDGRPLEAAYVDLLDGEEFIAERRTGPDGTFEFHTTPGTWTLMCRSSVTQPVRKQVESGPGEVDVSFDVA